MRWKQSQVTQEHAQLHKHAQHARRVRKPTSSKSGKKYDGQQVSTSVLEGKGRQGKM